MFIGRKTEFQSNMRVINCFDYNCQLWDKKKFTSLLELEYKQNFRDFFQYINRLKSVSNRCTWSYMFLVYLVYLVNYFFLPSV